jgi:hypothetical protein
MLPLLLHIQEVSGSYVEQDTGYPSWGFEAFIRSAQVDFGIVK